MLSQFKNSQEDSPGIFANTIPEVERPGPQSFAHRFIKNRLISMKIIRGIHSIHMPTALIAIRTSLLTIKHYGVHFPALISLFSVYFPYFGKMKVGLWKHLAVCVGIPPQRLLNALTNLYETWYVYHGTWAHVNGRLRKSLSSVCVSISVFPLSLLGNSSVDTFEWQRIVTW
jgi:hypothetical protein